MINVDLEVEGLPLPEFVGALSDVEVSIVMPCLNEAETLGTCIGKAQQWLRESGTRGEIVVADNGSTDGSQAIAGSFGVRVISVPRRGYGSALMGGIAAARGRYVIMGDADDSYNFADLDSLLKKLREGYDLVMGNRFKGGIRPGAMPPLHKYFGNPVLTGIGRLLFRSPCGDFHCGLRGFSKAAAGRMDLRTTGMEFASEMVVKATLHSMRITEVPVVLSPDGRSGASHMRRWREGWRHLRFLLLYSPRWLFLYPGALLMFIGCVVGAWLLPASRVVAGVTFDVHTLLFAAAAIVIGFQAVVFAVFTKIFAVSEALLPENPRLSQFLRFVNLEAGLVVGTLLLLTGTIGSVYVFGVWGERSFGALNPRETLRIAIPALTAVTLGCEVILSSFFLSVLRLRRR